MRKIESSQIYLLVPGKLELKPDRIVFPAKRRADAPPVEIKAPFSWNSDPYQDNNWLAQLQMWRPLDGHIIRYVKSGDIKWLAEPMSLIEDWHRYYLENSPGPYVWADMNVGMRAMKLAWFLALHHSGSCRLPEAFISICEKLRSTHLEALLGEDYLVSFNHAFMDLHGAMALAQTLPESEGNGIKIWAEDALENLLQKQFFPDGVYKENSPFYQGFALSCIERLSATGWFKTATLDRLSKKALKVFEAMHLPDGRLAPVGDTEYFPAPAFSEKIKAQDFEIFNSSGYVIFRSARKGSYLFFMCARHERHHKHSDDLSFFWYENEDILIDPGKFAYGESAERSYVTSTRAHNALEIDLCDEYSRGRPRRPRKPFCMVEEVKKRGSLFMASASMFIQEHDVVHRRLLVLQPDKWLLVCDSVFSTREHDYRFHWHFAPDSEIEFFGQNTFELRLLSGRKLHGLIHSSEKCGFRRIIGVEKPRLQGFCSIGYGKFVPASCLEISGPRVRWELATVFALDRAPGLERLEAGKYCLEYSGRKIRINAFRPDQAPLF